jgi:hypothetical protein
MLRQTVALLEVLNSEFAVKKKVVLHPAVTTVVVAVVLIA